MSRQATVERLVGWLTIALGIGALVSRQGGSFAMVLDQMGVRAEVGIFLIAAGAAQIIASLMLWRNIRMIGLLGSIVVWLALALLFVNSRLWGASLQALVVICFANKILWELQREA